MTITESTFLFEHFTTYFFKKNTFSFSISFPFVKSESDFYETKASTKVSLDY